MVESSLPRRPVVRYENSRPTESKLPTEACDVVERHVSRFGPDSDNQHMIAQLRRSRMASFEPTQTDLNFYSSRIAGICAVSSARMGNWETHPSPCRLSVMEQRSYSSIGGLRIA